MTLKHPKFLPMSESPADTFFCKKKLANQLKKPVQFLNERPGMPKQKEKKVDSSWCFDSFGGPHQQITKSSTLELSDGYTTMPARKPQQALIQPGQPRIVC